MNCARINGFSISSTMATAVFHRNAGWRRLISNWVVPGGTDRVRLPGSSRAAGGSVSTILRSLLRRSRTACAPGRIFPGTAAYPPVQRPAPLRAAGAADHQQALDAGLFDRGGEDLLGASSGLFAHGCLRPSRGCRR